MEEDDQQQQLVEESNSEDESWSEQQGGAAGDGGYEPRAYWCLFPATLHSRLRHSTAFTSADPSLLLPLAMAILPFILAAPAQQCDGR